jgi:hypothetical protein
MSGRIGVKHRRSQRDPLPDDEDRVVPRGADSMRARSRFPNWALKVRRMPQIRWVNKQRIWICSCRQDSG